MGSVKFKLSRAPYISEDPNDTGLRFTDVLFGFALREVVIRLAEWDRLSNAARVHLLLAATTILCSYIGFRNSQKRGRFELRFFNVALLRFGLDQVMVFFYFWLGIYVAADKDPMTGQLKLPSSEALLKFDARILVAIFVLYLLWDVFSHWMDHSNRYFLSADKPYQAEGYRTFISLGGLVAVGGVLFVEYHFEPTGSGAVWWMGGLIGIVIAYRFVKDAFQRESDPAPTPTPAATAAAAALAAAEEAVRAAAAAAEAVKAEAAKAAVEAPT